MESSLEGGMAALFFFRRQVVVMTLLCYSVYRFKKQYKFSLKHT